MRVVLVTRVLVTGGCGRIGRELVRKLSKGGDRMTVIDPKHGDVPGVKYITAPIGELKELEKQDVVYHLAASIDYSASREELYKRNVLPTMRLLKLCRECKQFILMSTTSVYGESNEPITERTPPRPCGSYGWSKLKCEELVRRSGLPHTIVRSSQVFGPDFEEGYAAVLKRIQEGSMKIFGDGQNCVPLIHLRDLLDALVLVRRNEGALNQTFNADGGYGKTQEGFMAAAARAMGAEESFFHVNPALAKLMGRLTRKKASVSEYVDKLAKNRLISIEKIRSLGFEPKVGLEEGLKEVVETFRERGILK